MASFEIVALDTVTPQLRAPGGTDNYSVPKDMLMPGGSLGIYANTILGTGIQFDTTNGDMAFYMGGNMAFRLRSTLASVQVGAYQLAFASAPLGGTAPDCGIARSASKVVKFTDGLIGIGPGMCLLPTFTVAGLPAAAGALTGARSTVSDGSVVAAGNFGTVVAGAGANIVPVYCDGTNWRVG